MHFIVKFFPEITIKSPPVRKRFVKHLRDNLRSLFKGLPFSVQVDRDWDKIDVYAEPNSADAIAQVAEVLAHTPGIAYFAQVQTFPLGDLDDIYEKTKAIWGDALAGKTFCVRAKRQGEHDFSSIEVEKYVGGGLNQHTDAAGVKLKNPDITVRMEIKRDQLHVIEKQTPGLGGFPLGTQEPVLSLISGGFDSTVSSYLTIKRGIRTHYCFFNLGGRAHEVAVKEVAYYLWSKYGASHRVMFVTVPFEDVVGEILEKVDNSQMGVVLKRMMLRAATQVAEQMEIPALVTGEAVAQVSSQTLTNLTVIDSVTDTLVLRPLIVMDKGEIIDVARKIGTEEFSAAIPEYCGVISRKPTTRAQEDRVAHEESKFDMSVLEKAVETRRMLPIDHVVDDLAADVQVEAQSIVASGQVVIDVRHPDEEELRPLQLEEVEILKIPFFRLSGSFANLDKSQHYLLYCDKGIMSQLHAANLKDDGYHNVGVYRPV
ncbi:MAG: tRNA 4-thiouridine(8) synthase ThiI [Cellvibrionaceae bacterium]|nr:tRNA 4-thiouridine(8) synthase ThiI [Cellvibrionaceae bacterium]